MEVVHVYLCINYDELSKEHVISELATEGYGSKYKFFFGNSMSEVEYADEFWTFGNVDEIEAYKKAVELGLDIWKMG